MKLNQSNINLWYKCPYAFYQQNILGIGFPTIPTALDFGKHMHEALVIGYTKTVQEAINHWDLYKGEADEKRTPAMGKLIIERYFQLHPVSELEIIALEKPFEIPIGKHIYTGVWDLIAKWGRPAFLFDFEHKTTSGMGTTFFDQFTPDIQIAGYYYAGKQLLGKEYNGIIMNGLRVAKYMDKDDSKNFGRKILNPTQFEVEGFLGQFTNVADQIEFALANWTEEQWKANKHYSSCWDYFTKCSYWNLCVYNHNKLTYNSDKQLWLKEQGLLKGV